ncbi:kinase-like domain-containing protein [Hyaloraphidium curvatum]|nr:kinase-like domain-containing protein [Hyaloraphidium curvatum]
MAQAARPLPSFTDFPASIADLTAPWLESVFRAHGLDARVASIEAKQVGTGQVGGSYRITVSYDGDPGEAPPTVVAKLVSEDPDSRKTGFATRTYEREEYFYRHLSGRLRTKGMRIAKCWAAEHAPEREAALLLLEDLAPANAGDQLAGCDPGRAELALREAAKLHAEFWASEELPKLGGFLGMPGNPQAAAGLAQVYQGSWWPGFVERYKPRMTPHILALGSRLARSLRGWLLLRARPPLTLAHSDLRIDNLMFPPAGNPGGDYCCVVDWQTLQVGQGAVDVGYFLGGSLLPEDRRKHARRLVEVWRGELLANGVKDCTAEQAWDGFRQGFFASMVMAVAAGMTVGRTDRGDEMFWAMFARAAEAAIETGAEELLPAEEGAEAGQVPAP